HTSRLEKNFDVEPERLFLDVLDVVVNPFLEIGFDFALARDLPEAGDAGTDAQACFAPGRAHLVFAVGAGTGADDAHIANQHVEELRPLVDVQSAQPAAEPENARVALDFEL